jgi:hypothetical protein
MQYVWVENGERWKNVCWVFDLDAIDSFYRHNEVEIELTVHPYTLLRLHIALVSFSMAMLK